MALVDCYVAIHNIVAIDTFVVTSIPKAILQVVLLVNEEMNTVNIREDFYVVFHCLSRSCDIVQGKLPNLYLPPAVVLITVQGVSFTGQKFCLSNLFVVKTFAASPLVL